MKYFIEPDVIVKMSQQNRVVKFSQIFFEQKKKQFENLFH